MLIIRERAFGPDGHVVEIDRFNPRRDSVVSFFMGLGVAVVKRTSSVKTYSLNSHQLERFKTFCSIMGI